MYTYDKCTLEKIQWNLKVKAHNVNLHESYSNSVQKNLFFSKSESIFTLTRSQRTSIAEQMHLYDTPDFDKVFFFFGYRADCYNL